MYICVCVHMCIYKCICLYVHIHIYTIQPAFRTQEHTPSGQENDRIGKDTLFRNDHGRKHIEETNLHPKRQSGLVRRSVREIGHLYVAAVEDEFAARLVRGHHVACESINVAHIPDVFVLSLDYPVVCMYREREREKDGERERERGGARTRRRG